MFAPSDRPRAATAAGWATRFYEAADEVFWAAELNLLWLVFTLAGGVVLGIGPADQRGPAAAGRSPVGGNIGVPIRSLAGIRRRVPTRVQTWLSPGPSPGRDDRPQLLLLRLTRIGRDGFPAGHLRGNPRPGRDRDVPAAHVRALQPANVQQLPQSLAVCPHSSGRLRPAARALFTFAGLSCAPPPRRTPAPWQLVVAVGGWIQLDTWLCLRLFAENEARLHAKGLS
ncbi:DUF624 domain-containing protein [Plantactinospora sp. CA-290183]|uniref:DUF624 domain-containing protein n=1 Tax=Plantactinospora sp. CA-290183 TaxID=3240006 RepID=UPI003D916AD7